MAAAVRGNDALVPERGVSAEVGLSTELRFPTLSAYGQLVGHGRFADRLIAYRRSSFGFVRPYNIGQARILGVEALAGAVWLRTFALSTSLVVLDRAMSPRAEPRRTT